MLDTILSTLGFSQEEVKLYVLLLELGPTTVGSLAKAAGMPRPSLYGFLKRMQDKGIIIQTLKSGLKVFAAEPATKIDTLFQEEISKLEKNKKAYLDLLPNLEKISPAKFINPKFQLFEGEEGVKHVLEDMLLYREIETQAFWPIKSMLETLSPEFFRFHNKERIRKNLYTRAIWPKKEIVDIKTHPYLGVGKDFKREIRIAPKEIDFSMGYWIYKNKVAFISSKKEGFGFIIESRELVEMLLSQFEIIWKLSKKHEVKSKDTEVFLKELI